MQRDDQNTIPFTDLQKSESQRPLKAKPRRSICRHSEEIINDYIGVCTLCKKTNLLFVIINKNNGGLEKCDVTETLTPQMPRQTLNMLDHSYTTKKSMNMSVASYAPKEETFSTIDALNYILRMQPLTIEEYVKFWENTFMRFDLTMNANLIQVSNALD